MTEDKLPESGPRRRRRRRRSPQQADVGEPKSVTVDSSSESTSAAPEATDGKAPPPRRRRRRRRPGAIPDAASDESASTDLKTDSTQSAVPARKSERPPKRTSKPPVEVEIEGILDMFPGGSGYLRQIDADLAEQKTDPMVPANIIKKFHHFFCIYFTFLLDFLAFAFLLHFFCIS